MKRNQVVKHMMNELNFFVKHYDATKDLEVKKEWEKDYENTAKAFNGLLFEISGTLDGPSFSRNIEKYKKDREWKYSE